ncbi:hypothetical protein BASA83_001735 [Batrachochytrium salamandrivorans]|nr:hypothetical protein BASA83_001735 [Batrachochytrium salamandrivorans]
MSATLIKDINRDYNDVETALARIQSHKGVQGIVIATHEGSVIRSTLDNIQHLRYPLWWCSWQQEDELTFLRIQSKHEIMVAESKCTITSLQPCSLFFYVTV